MIPKANVKLFVLIWFYHFTSTMSLKKLTRGFPTQVKSKLVRAQVKSTFGACSDKLVLVSVPQHSTGSASFQGQGLA